MKSSAAAKIKGGGTLARLAFSALRNQDPREFKDEKLNLGAVSWHSTSLATMLPWGTRVRCEDLPSGGRASPSTLNLTPSHSRLPHC